MSENELLTYNILKEKILSDDNTLQIIKNINYKYSIPITEKLTDKYFEFMKKVNISKIILLYRNDMNQINNYLVKTFIYLYFKKEEINIRDILYQEIRNNTTYIMDDDSNNFNRLRNRDDPNLTNVNETAYTQNNYTYNNHMQTNVQNNTEEFSNYRNTNNNTVSKINNNGIPRFNYNHIQYNDIILVVDTRYQNLSNTDRTKFLFNVSNNMKKKYIRSGNITAVGNITNIVQFEISSLSIPYIPVANNKHGIIRLRLNDFTSDCCEDYEFVYHWVFNIKYIEETNRIELTPVDKIYKFRKPITELDGLSMTFGSPCVPIKFDADRLFTSNIDYTTNPGIFTFPENHNLATGDCIIITGFTSLTPGEDQTVLEQINNPHGHPVTVVSCTQICADGIELDKIKNPDPDFNVEIFFDSKRIICNIKVKYIINDTS